MRLTVLWLLASALLPSLAQAQGPVFTITPEESDVKFFVKASVAIDGKFNKWEATLTFPSTDVTSGVLDIKIYADSVNTGSGMKDNKLKSKDFFNASQDPYITFDSTEVVQTGPNTFDVQGTFTIRGVSKPETLNLTLTGKGTGEGRIKGTMAFDRKDYGMNKGIPFVKIGDRLSTRNRNVKRYDALTPHLFPLVGVISLTLATPVTILFASERRVPAADLTAFYKCLHT